MRVHIPMVFLVAGILVGPVPGGDEFIVLGEGYQKNVDAFREYVCEFTVRDSKANSIRDVFENKNIHHGSRVFYATWVVKGVRERFYGSSEKICNTAAEKQAP